MIYEACENTDIDYVIAIAISRHETGHYTSNAFVYYNNFGGMISSNGLMQFASKEEGLNRYISMLQWYYDDGLDTIEKIQKRYCPSGGSQWIASVSAIYKELQDGKY